MNKFGVKHFQYDSQLVKFVNHFKEYIEVAGVAEAGRFSEGFKVFFWYPTHIEDEIKEFKLY